MSSSVFTPLTIGRVSRNNVIIEWGHNPIELSRSLQDEIETFWNERPGSFNGTLARLDQWYRADNSLVLYLRPTDYRTLLFSNNNVEYIRKMWGDRYLSRALGISAVVVTNDNCLWLMKRSDSVGEYPNCYDVFGGHINVKEFEKPPDVFSAILEELEEEMGLPSHSCDLTCFGLIETTEHIKPELLFKARIDLDSSDVLQLAKHARDGCEYTQILSIMDDDDAISEFIESKKTDISPSAYGCLSCYLAEMKTI